MRRRARPVLLMAARDLRRRSLRTALVAVLLTVLTTVGAFMATFMVPTTASGVGNIDTWSAVATDVLFVVGLGVVCLVTAPIHLAAARRNLRHLGLLEAAGARGRDLVATMLAPTALTSTVAALSGSALGFVLGTNLIGMNDSLAPHVVVAQAFAAGAVAVIVIAANLAAAAVPAWRMRALSIVDALRAHAPATPRAGGAGTIVAAVATIAGTAGLVLGLPERSLALLAPSVVLLWAGGGGLLAVGVTRLLRRGGRGPFSLRYAVADGARHPARIVPAVIAGASLVTILVASMAYIGSTHAAAWDRYVPMGPLGSALLFSYAPSSGAPTGPDADAAEATVAELAPEATTTPLLIPAVPLQLQVDGVPHAVVETEGTLVGSTFVGTSGLADASHLPAEVVEALDAGHIVTRPGALPDGETTAIVLPGGDVATVVEEILPGTAPGRILVPPAAVDAGLPVTVAAVVVAGLDYAALEELGQAVQPSGYMIAIEQGPPELDSAPTQYALLGVAAGVVLLIIWLMGALSREESRADVVTLEAVGARPSFTRWAAAWQAGGTGLLAALAGAAAGPPAAALLMAVRDDMYAPHVSTPLIVPWLPLIGVVVVTPLVAALGVAALQPRRPLLVRRLAD